MIILCNGDGPSTRALTDPPDRLKGPFPLLFVIVLVVFFRRDVMNP